MKTGINQIGAGVGAIIINEEGKALMSLRGKEARNERGRWEFPGAEVEFGEEMRQALIREVKEEHDIDIKIGKILGAYDHIIPDEGQHWVSVTFVCKITLGEPKILEPHTCDRIAWFDIGEMQDIPLTIIAQKNVDTISEEYGGKLAKIKD